MIFQTIINFLYSVAVLLIGFLPNPSEQDYINLVSISDSINGVRSFLIWANLFFPLDDLFIILRLVIAIELIYFSFRISRWVASIFSAGFVK